MNEHFAVVRNLPIIEKCLSFSHHLGTVHSGHLHEPGTHSGYGPRGSREAGTGAAGHLLRSLQGWRPQVSEYNGKNGGL
jgi:hypothetical protein